MYREKSSPPSSWGRRRDILNGYGRGEDRPAKEKASSVITRETFGMTLLLFSVVLLFISALGSYMLGEIGVAINAFLLGVFGFFLYPFLLFCVGLSLRMITGKKVFAGKRVLLTMAVVASVFLVVHLATSARFTGNGFGGYLGGCWNAAAASAAEATGGGVLFGVIVYPVQALLSQVGAYLVFSLLIALTVFFFLWTTPLKDKLKHSRAPKAQTVEKAAPAPVRGQEEGPRMPQGEDRPRPSAPGKQPQQPAYGQYAQPQQPAYGQYAQPQQPAYGQYQQPQQPAYGQYQQPQQPAYGQYTQPQQPAYGQYQPQQGRAGAYNAPYMDNFDRYTPQMPQTAPVDPMDILYGDPASNYRNNPIFDKDSRYNTLRRRSSVEPEDSPVRANPREIPSSFVPSPDRSRAGYSERYAAAAETPRPAMPRKVVEQRAESPASDLNYSFKPYYKAPDSPDVQEAHGFYENDVPFEEEFSSAPNVDDEPVRTAPELRRASPEPCPEPVKSEPRAELFPRAEEPVSAGAQDSRRTVGSDRGFGFGSDRSGDLGFTSDRDRSGDLGFTSDRDRSGDLGFTSDRDRSSDLGFTSDRDRGGDLGFTSDRDRGGDLGFTSDRDRSSDLGFGGDRDRGSDLGFTSDRDRSGDLGFTSDRDRGGDLGFTSDRDRSGDLGFTSDRDRGGDLGFGGDRDPGREEFGSRAAEGLSRADLFDDDEPETEPDLPAMPRTPMRPVREETHPVPPTPAPKPQKHIYRPYQRPSLSIFHQYDESVTVDREEIEQNSQTIIDTLAGFRMDVEVMRVAVGPSVTRYDINIPKNISVGMVTKKDDDVAMRLHARDGVNMYSNNESGFISIEVPNKNRAIVGVRSILQSEEYLKEKPGALMFAIGKDLEGRCVCGNITKMKHILVAGATGSGKSVCLNAMLISLLCKYSPEDLRIILIDPKKVEFTIYDGLPHLMINEIIADAQKAVTALNWAIKEMERRYELFEQKTRSGVVVRELDEYNRHLNEDEQKLPKIVIVVDELADLMAVAKKDIEERIQRLTQKARAAGIHLVIATQRPSVDVITGVIKGNLPTRMAFRVIQEVDSRTILDESGAQKLLGNGDMLYRTEGMFNCLRVQGAFLSSEEVQAVLTEIKANNEAYFDPAVADFINNTQSGGEDGDAEGMEDGEANTEYIRALGMVVKLGQASISLIQRKCSIGYNHAGKIIEWMELMGYISPFDGKAKARTVLLTKEEYESKYGPLD